MTMLKSMTAKIWRDVRMPYVETRQASHSDVSYQAHSHSTFSIGAVDAGESQFKSQFNSQYQYLTAGTLVLIPAQLEHCCNPVPDQVWSYHMMHLDQTWLDVLLSEHIEFAQSRVKKNTYTDSALAQHLPQFAAQVLQTPTLYTAFIALNRLLFDPAISVNEKEQALVECLSQLLLPSFSWKSWQHEIKDAELMNHMIEIMRDTDQFISLEQLSQQVGVSRYAIIRLFKQTLGFTPHAFQLNLRIQHGRELLKQGVSITEAAYQLGFCDQSHFHRVFKKLCAVTPLQYQQTR